MLLESDSQLLVQELQRQDELDSIFGLIFGDCKIVLKDLGNCIFSYIKRSVNQVAHVLAKAVGSMFDRGEWEHVPPPFLINLLRADI